MSNPSATYSTSEASLWERISTFHKVKLAFLAAAFFSFALSVVLWFLVDKETGLFVGLWVPSLLALGVLVLVGEDESP
jgi:hypothetical protein